MTAGTVYVGIDLGGKFHQVQVTDGSGHGLGRSFRIGRGRQALVDLDRELAARIGDREKVYTIEATQNYWLELVHPLVGRGQRVHLVSPSKSSALRTFYRRHTKTDGIDAGALARVPLVDASVRPVQRSDPRFEMLRRLGREYWRVKSQMSDRKRRIMTRVLMIYPGYDAVFRDRYCGASLLFCRRYLNPARARRLGRRRLTEVLRQRAHGKFDEARATRLWAVIENAPELELDYEDLQFVVNQDLDLLEAEDRSRRALKERMAEIYTDADPETLLKSLPGLGDILAAIITAFIGEPGRFRSADEVVALAGLYPRKKSSAGTDKPNQPLSRHGDPTLRSCLYLAAEIARHYDPELRAFHQRLTGRGKHYKLASCAVAAKILRRCFAVLRDRRPYTLTGHAGIQAGKAQGKTVRQSVHEVAVRLNDEGNTPSPTTEPYLGSDLPATPVGSLGG